MDTSEVWKLFFEAYFIVEIKKKKHSDCKSLMET